MNQSNHKHESHQRPGGSFSFSITTGRNPFPWPFRPLTHSPYAFPLSIPDWPPFPFRFSTNTNQIEECYVAAKCSCRLQAFAHLQASQGKYHEADATYGPLPNNSNRGNSDGVLFSGLPGTRYYYGRSIAQ